MVQLRPRGADHAPAAGAHAQAEIDVVAGDGEMLAFEPAHFFEHPPPHHHAGAGHRRHAARVPQHPAIARRVAGGAAQQMRRHRARPDRHAGVLHPAVRIQQPGSHHADLRPLRQRHHLAQPVGMDRLNVVVQQRQHGAARQARRGIVHRRPVERAGEAQHAHARIRRQPGQQPRGGAPATVVVDDDQFDCGIVGAPQQ